ncbi:MAG: S8 family serine peptidase [Pseudomonadota bacterium]
MRIVKVMRAVLFLGAFLFASLAQAQSQSWRLVDADQIASGSFLILTVPMADDTSLTAIATEIESRYGVSLAAEWPLRSISVHCFVMNAEGHSDVDALIGRMEADGQIRTVQRMQEFDTFDAVPDRYRDPLLPSQRALTELNIVQAHLKSTGSGVTVGIVDSGIDRTHPDLANRLVEMRDFVATDPTAPPEAHGTAVAGVIGADAENEAGMVGVAPGAELVGLRACWQEADRSGRCSSFSLARSLNFAILNGIDVLNLSLGGPPDPLLEELVTSALDQGAVIVAAWGELAEPTFPASVPGVIAAGRPEYGGLPAPSTDIISTAPGARYGYFSGSSVAAAHVSGVVALLLASRNDLEPDDIARVLDHALTDKDGQTAIDACLALQTVTGQQSSCSS